MTLAISGAYFSEFPTIHIYSLDPLHHPKKTEFEMSLPDNLMLASYNLPCWHSIFPSKFWHYPLEPFCHQAASPKKTLQSRVPAPLGEALSDAPPEDRSGDRGGSAGEDRTGSVKEDWGWENFAWVACCFIFCLTVGGSRMPS